MTMTDPMVKDSAEGGRAPSSTSRLNYRSHSLLIGGLALVGAAFPVVIGWATGSLHSGQTNYWLYLVAQVLVLGIFALAYDLVLGRTGLLSLGHALMFGGAIYVLAITLRSGVPFLFAAALAVGFACLIGVIFGLLAMRAKGIYLGMITLAVAEAFRVLVISPSVGHVTGAEDGLRNLPLPVIIDPGLNRLNLYYVILGVLVVTVVFMRWLMTTTGGHSLVAIRENEERMKNLGYPVGRYKLLAFAISGMLSGIAGVLACVLFAGAAPTMLTIDQTAIPLMAVIIGGAGTIAGPLAGIAFVALSQEFLRSFVAGLWPVVYALLGIVIITLAPGGIIGLSRRFGITTLFSTIRARKGK